MEEEIKEIHIIPAIFLNYREDGNILIKCLQGNETVNRAFEPNLVRGLENPKYLFIGLLTGKNMMQISIKDGSNYEEMFKEKWDKLL
jgi:hypothetical protein